MTRIAHKVSIIAACFLVAAAVGFAMHGMAWAW